MNRLFVANTASRVGQRGAALLLAMLTVTLVATLAAELGRFADDWDVKLTAGAA